MASCLAVTTEMLPVGLLPDIGATFSMPESVTGLLVTLYAMMVAALAVPLTVATTRFDRRPLLLATLLGYVVSNVLVAAAPTFAVVAAGRAVGGLTHALFFSLTIGYVPRLVSRADVGRALAIVSGRLIGGIRSRNAPFDLVGTAAGWRVSFAVLAALSCLTFVAVYKLLPRVDHAPHASRRDEKRPSRTCRRLGIQSADVPRPFHGVHVHQCAAALQWSQPGVRRPDSVGVRRLWADRPVVGRAQSRPQPTSYRGSRARRRHRRGRGTGHLLADAHRGARGDRVVEWGIRRYSVHLPGHRGTHACAAPRTGRRLGERHGECRYRRWGRHRRGVCFKPWVSHRCPGWPRSWSGWDSRWR